MSRSMAEILKDSNDEQIPTDPLTMRTPCCSRATRKAEPMRSTNVVRRTCPKCRARWQIVIVPMLARGGMRMDRLEWLRLRGAQ